MEEIIFASGSVPVAVAARVYGKDASWIRAGIPCCKDVYYDLYRRFFWLLSKERQ